MPVQIGRNDPYSPPDYRLVPYLLNHIVLQIQKVTENNDYINMIAIIFKFFYDFIAIQPFRNGNTHTAKILAQLLLRVYVHPIFCGLSFCNIGQIQGDVANANYSSSFFSELKRWYNSNASYSTKNIRYWLAILCRHIVFIKDSLQKIKQYPLLPSGLLIDSYDEEIIQLVNNLFVTDPSLIPYKITTIKSANGITTIKPTNSSKQNK